MSTRRTLRNMTADFGWSEIVIGALIVASVIASFAVVIIWGGRSNPHEHSWRGGSGPSTVCFYESRTETASDGKSVIPVQYTVCRDAR